MPRASINAIALLCLTLSAWGQTPATGAAPEGQTPAAGEGQNSGQTPLSGPQRFAFSYTTGDKFRVLSEVEESVYVNRQLSHRARILNRIAFEIADAAHDGSWGFLRGSFETSEQQIGGEAYVISERYDSEFKRDRLGRYEIDPKYYMPVVRNVPVFPDRPLSPGESWTAPGEERHDFRRAFAIPDPYTIPFEARYRYLGPEQRGGKELLVLTASYTIFERPRPPRSYASIFPIQIAGYSDQKIWWDPELGQPVAYEERFDFVFDWSDGTIIEYKGSATSDVVEAELMDREALKAEAEKAVEGIEGVSVEATEEGVTISLENLQFEPDSAVLKASELEKLARIGELLARYPERDVLVSGHAAAAGYAAGRQKLSEERAGAVAERLIAIGAKKAERIRAVGYGDTRPVADNSTEEGRSRNRRVEITILEN